MKVLGNLARTDFCLIFFAIISLIGCCNYSDRSSSSKIDFDDISLYDDHIFFENDRSSDTVSKSLTKLEEFENYKTLFDTINIDDIIYYIAEGDLLLDVDELRFRFNKTNSPDQSVKLVGIIRDGEIVRIENPSSIKYAIIKQTFSEREYSNIVKYMAEATLDWERVCNVNFVHISDLDTLLRPNDNPDELTFVVKKIGYSSGDLIASSFFPYDPKYKRKILITPLFFTTSFEQAGVLRHEIGHILGFRHEHIRSGAPALCPKESLEFTIDLTQYDPQSVMHYFCGGLGTRELRITSIDSIGASEYYR